MGFGPVVISPSYQDTSSSHLLNTKLILRQAKYQSFVANGTVEPCVFPVLIDTGCSVACTGFKEDFDGALVPGEFGNIKPANGTASIQGFGLVSWHTVSEEGTPLIVKVPAYYAPDIQLRLFSPQDYARYHKLLREEIIHIFHGGLTGNS